MTDPSRCCPENQELVNHVLDVHLNGIDALYVLGLWCDPNSDQDKIDDMVRSVQVGPGFCIDGIDAERGVIQLSITVGAKDTDEAQAYCDEWVDELTNKSLAKSGISRFEMTWTDDVHAELFNRSLPQYIDKKFLQKSYVFTESES